MGLRTGRNEGEHEGENGIEKHLEALDAHGGGGKRLASAATVGEGPLVPHFRTWAPGYPMPLQTIIELFQHR